MTDQVHGTPEPPSGTAAVPPPDPPPKRDSGREASPGVFRRLLRGASYLSLVVVLAALVAYLVPPATVISTLSGLRGARDATSGQDTIQQTIQETQTERSSAYLNHFGISLWFANCSGFTSVGEMPDDMVSILAPYGESWSGSKKSKLNKPPTPQQREIMQLSQMLYRERIAQGAHVQSTYASAQAMQWTIIIIGFLTTIMVALSSSQYGQGNTFWPSILRLFAIMLPVLGTAVASLNAYYAPSQQLGQAKSTLASLSQLHGQVALEIWTAGCNADKIDKLAAQWVKRYQEIQTVAATGPETKTSEGSGAPSGPKVPSGSTKK